VQDTPIIEAFLISRRLESTREYSKRIIEFLRSNTTSENSGWVRTKDLKEAIVPQIIPNDSSFFKLLEDMEQYQVIEKKTFKKEIPSKGRSPTYYRLKSNNLLSFQGDLSRLHKEREELLSQSPEELVNRIGEITIEKLELELRLDIAIKLLQEAGITPDEIEKEVRELTE